MSHTIIGGGLSGLCAGHFFKPHIVYEAGSIHNPWHGTHGPMWIHYEKYAADFFKSIGLTMKEFPYVDKSVGLMINGRVDIIDEYPGDKEELKEMYCQKTRMCELNELPETDSIMNFGNARFCVFDIDHDELWGRLQNGVKVQQYTKVEKINIDASTMKISDEGNSRMYQDIISTIPMNKLMAMCGHADRAAELTWVDTLIFPILGDFSKYSYTYVPQHNYQISRICGRAVEVPFIDGMDIARTTMLVKSDLKSLGILFDESHFWPVRKSPAYFRPTEFDAEEYAKELKEQSINLVGRYARWDHRIKFGDVVKQLEEMAE